MPTVEITGADDLDAFVKRVRKHADAKAFRKELHSGLNRVSKPVREEMKESTGEPSALPTRGGLQALAVSKQSITTSLRGGKYAGLSIKVASRKGGIDIGAVHRGSLRRPVFGRKWVTQTAGVKPRWMESVFEEQKADVAKALLQVIADVARKVDG